MSHHCTDPNDPACPQLVHAGYDKPGMTKRQYFAAHAPVAWYVNNFDVKEGAKQAVAWADVLIAELNK